MPESFLQQNLSQQQTLALQIRKSLEILQASTMEPSGEEKDSLNHLNTTDDDWRDRSILDGTSANWSE